MLSRCAMSVLGLLCAAGAALASPTYSEFSAPFDLPNAPVNSIAPGAPTYVIPGPGVWHIAVGFELGGMPDIDFINILFAFTAGFVVVDVDQSNANQNSLLGVGLLGNLPAWTNDDDLNGPLDAYAGVNTWATDSALDLTAAYGGNIPASSAFTVCITRTGDAGFDGNGNPYKLEWNLWVYAEAVPTAPTGLMAGAGLLALSRRRRRECGPGETTTTSA